ncbi:MAG: nitroreductase family protein [Proteobacteria bacterium]|nr:nitroreductase family protein [Pseudomonadota bacterium]
MADHGSAKRIEAALALRFGERVRVDPDLAGLDEIARIAAHRVHRRYIERAVDPDLVRLLCACALSAPSKSDLQQADILILRDRSKIAAIAALIPDMPWIAQAPVFLVFLANGRRLRRIFEIRGQDFPNDHLDQFFNAVSDASIVLATFLRAAGAVGLGACPISVIRDHAAEVSDMLELPARVIPLAGMTVGWPAEAGGVTARLDLACTLHEDRYVEGDLAARLDAYDHRRAAARPYARQRAPERWGTAPFYGWSEDKARQYGVPQRPDFGAFVRARGFCLD